MPLSFDSKQFYNLFQNWNKIMTSAESCDKTLTKKKNKKELLFLSLLELTCFTEMPLPLICASSLLFL